MKTILAIMLAVASVSAAAQVSTARIVCDAQMRPQIEFEYYAKSDAGKPALFYAGIATPDQQNGGMLDEKMTWLKYQGGLYVPTGRYENAGIPGVIRFTVNLPSNHPHRTTGLEEYLIVAGHGVLTPRSLEAVAARRELLNQAKMTRTPSQWNKAYDVDDQYLFSLAEKEMRYKGTFLQLATVPYLECDARESN